MISSSSSYLNSFYKDLIPILRLQTGLYPTPPREQVQGDAGASPDPVCPGQRMAVSLELDFDITACSENRL